MSKKKPVVFRKDAMIPVYGHIVYDPERNHDKNVKDWCIISVDEELTRYLRWFVDRELLNITGVPGFGLHGPSNGSHISIVRGVNDTKDASPEHYKKFWGKYEGRKVKFWYEPIVKTAPAKRGTDGVHYYVDVACDFAMQIRRELRLPADWKFHLTIGRTYVHG